VTNEPLQVGDFVRLVVPDDRRHDASARGRVTAYEKYTDDQGTRTWIYVRWFNDDGKPDSEQMRHSYDELEKA